MRISVVDPEQLHASSTDLLITWGLCLARIRQARNPLSEIRDAPATEAVGMMEDDDPSVFQADGSDSNGPTASILDPSYDSDTADDPISVMDSSRTPSTTDLVKLASDAEKRVPRRRHIRRRKKTSSKPFQFESFGKEILGLVFIDIKKITDLPPFRNMTRTSFDMDPYVILSFGKRVFRTKVVRHNLNPVYNEKVVFQVLKGEEGFTINFKVVDRDKLTKNDLIAEAVIKITDLMQSAGTDKCPLDSDVQDTCQDDNDTGSRSSTQDFNDPGVPDSYSSSQVMEINLQLAQDSFEGKHKPVLHASCNFVSFQELYLQFWQRLLQRFDSEDRGRISKIELTTMLDLLGSTFRETTINSFFERYGICPDDYESGISYEQAIQCLDTYLKTSEVSKANMASTVPNDSPRPVPMSREGTSSSGEIQALSLSEISLDQDTFKTMEQLSINLADLGDPNEADSGTEHLIMISECPFCHDVTGLSNVRDLDVLTHMICCLSKDWKMMDRLLMGGLVSSSQAQRNWYSKIVTKIAYGGYKIGANSANTLVQDRSTGQIQEERMSFYVRLGIRLLYKGMSSRRRMESYRTRRLLKSMSVKQGRKYDSPMSRRDILSFIKFHKLNMDEVRLPLSEFRTFNEFFYRELKAGSRPCAEPERPEVAVSPADSRAVCYDTVSDATQFWVKGRGFTVRRLLGDSIPEMVAQSYVDDGAMGIFRLAPQDYHRFHSPVDGVVGEPVVYAGQYYTVNPMAIRSMLDVFGENVRVVVPIQSDCHGLVMVVCVGAMMVGSTVITATPGERIARTDELGYFKFGGSTVIVLFERGRLAFDSDLVENSKSAIETLVRVGHSIGTAKQN